MSILSDTKLESNVVGISQGNNSHSFTAHTISQCLIAVAKIINTATHKNKLQEILQIINEYLNYDLTGIALKEDNIPYLKFINIHKDLHFKHGTMSIFPPNAIVKSCYLHQKKISTHVMPQEFDLKNKPLIFNGYPILYNNEFLGILYAGTRYRQDTSILDAMANLLASYLKAQTLSHLNETANNNDSLTGLYTSSFFNDRLKQEIKRYERIGSPISVILIDINNLKHINNQYGYETGNKCLIAVSKAVENSIRSLDVPTRYGGDEIIVLLPETNNENANFVGTRICQAISKIKIPSLNHFTVGIGIATYPDTVTETEHLITLADQALYLAKKEGKDKSKIVNAGRLESSQNAVPQTIQKIITPGNKNINDQFLKNINKCVRLSPGELYKPYVQGVILSIAGTIDAKDKGTRGHSQAVSFFARELAQAMGLTAREIEIIRLGGLLHDVGKIGIPEAILCKPGPLNDKEWDIMKQHPTIGAEKILKYISAFSEIVPIVALHHERWDGSGYPYGMKGENIPLNARIVAIVDSFHTMISARPYKNALKIPEAMNIIEAGAGVFWDPDITKIFIKNITKSLKKVS